MVTKFILLAALLWAIPSSATTYYVDNCVTVGNDSNNGTSTATPWLTIAKVDAQTFAANDFILFRRTCTFAGQLLPPSSGTTGNQITFSAYGSGAQPKIDGTGQNFSIIVADKSYVTISDLNPIGTPTFNALIKVYAQNVSISGVQVLNNTCSGQTWCVDVLGASSSVFPTQTTVQGNLASGDVLECDYFADNCNMLFNYVSGGTVNMTCDGCRNSTFQGNVIVGASVAGMQFQNFSPGGWTPPIGNNFFNNTLYNNTTSILINASTTNLTVKNNVVYAGANYLVDLENFTFSGLAFDYNDYYPGTASSFIYGAGPTTGTLAQWQVSQTQDSHSFIGNPLFTNAGSNQFTLLTGSPAIDAGLALGNTYINALLPSSIWPEGVLTGNQSAYGTGWEIGAFLYTNSTINGTSQLGGQSSIFGSAVIH